MSSALLFASYITPDNVLSQVENLIAGKKEVESLELIHDYLNLKKAKTWSHAFEKLMEYHVEFSLKHEKYNYIRDGLAAYRNITQSSNVSSLETILKTYITRVENSFNASIENIENPAEFLSVIENEYNPEDIFFNSFNTEYDERKTRVQKNWKLLMDAFKTELELIYKNTRLKDMYCVIAKKAFAKCNEFSKKTEFKKFCDLIHSHQTNNIKSYEKYLQSTSSSQIFALNIKEEETNEILIELRIYELDLAKKMELWQNCYKILTDLNVLMRNRKKIQYSLLNLYYENMSIIFWHVKLFHFHAIAYHSYFAALTRNKTEKYDKEMMSSNLIMAALSIPDASTESKMPQEVFTRNCYLLSSAGQIMTKRQLLDNLANGTYLDICDKDVRKLFYLYYNAKNVLKFSKSAEKIFADLKAGGKYTNYLPLIEDNLINELIQRISKLYKTMSFKTFRKFMGFFDPIKCEKVVLYSSINGGTSVKVDYLEDMLIFGHEDDFNNKINQSIVDYLNNLCIIDKSVKRILMKNNGDWDRLKDRCLVQAKQFIKSEEDEMNDRRTQVKEFIKKREEIDLTEVKANRGMDDDVKKTLVAHERRLQQKDHEQFVILNERVKQVISLDKNAILKGKKLTAYSESEIAKIDIENLIDLEEGIKEKIRRKEEERQLLMFRNKDFIARELKKERCDFMVKAAKENKIDIEEYKTKAEEVHKKKMELKEKLLRAMSYKKKYEEKIMKDRKAQLEVDMEAYKVSIREQFAQKLFDRAKSEFERKIREEEELKKQREAAAKAKEERGGGLEDTTTAIKLERNTTKKMARFGEDQGSIGGGLGGGLAQRGQDREETQNIGLVQRGSGLRRSDNDDDDFKALARRGAGRKVKASGRSDPFGDAKPTDDPFGGIKPVSLTSQDGLLKKRLIAPITTGIKKEDEEEKEEPKGRGFARGFQAVTDKMSKAKRTGGRTFGDI